MPYGAFGLIYNPEYFNIKLYKRGMVINMDSFRGKSPQTQPCTYIAPGVRLVGDITIGQNCSIWHNAVIRADVDRVVIGDGTNIQDNAVVHEHNGLPTIIGKDVTIGHSAIVHACTIGDNTLIGMGSIILDGAVIGKNCVVGAGALVTSNTIIPDGMLVLGSPAKAVKPLTEAQIAHNAQSAINYINLSREYLKEEQKG